VRRPDISLLGFFGDVPGVKERLSDEIKVTPGYISKQIQEMFRALADSWLTSSLSPSRRIS
jgi:hypothetical protein